jgi:hypothetical protein
MLGTIGDGVELHVARQHTVLFAVDIEIDHAGKETILVYLRFKDTRFHRDQQRGFFVTVNYAGNESGSARRTGGPFTGPISCTRRQRRNVGHNRAPWVNGTPTFLKAEACRRRPPGVPVA